MKFDAWHRYRRREKREGRGRQRGQAVSSFLDRLAPMLLVCRVVGGRMLVDKVPE